MGTGIMNGSSSFDSATNTLSEDGTFSSPMEGNKSYRGVTKIIDNDIFTYECYITGPGGKEFRAMQITYTRKK